MSSQLSKLAENRTLDHEYGLPLGRTSIEPVQGKLFGETLPPRVARYPQIRFMGSKSRLLPWIHSILTEIPFQSAADIFAGSGCVGYMLKAINKQVISSDFLNFSATLAQALIENPGRRLSASSIELLLSDCRNHPDFIEKTFSGIFFTNDDLRFLDRVCWNLNQIHDPYEQALAKAALIRSCVKRQPRGVFTIAGDPEHYKDGRRDLQLSLEEHFKEQIIVYNEAVFDNGKSNRAYRADIFDLELPEPVDLVYMDPPYVPRADDNCYIKRYHFLEGLSCYWEGQKIMFDTKVKKIQKPFTPFSYRKTSMDAFERMFRKYADSILVLSYSSNGYPDLAVLRKLLSKFKSRIDVHERAHRYHFGTHKAVKRSQVQEYLLIGY